MVTLVVINGHSGSGKDTFVEYCRAYNRMTRKMPFFNYHRSDFAKFMLEMMGWNGYKSTKTRKLLADIVDFGEETGYNLEKLCERVELHKEQIIFYHDRDPKSIENILNKYYFDKDCNVITLLVSRQCGEEITVEKDTWGIENYTYDVTIDNSGTIEDLKQKAVEFMEKIYSSYGGTKNGCE